MFFIWSHSSKLVNVFLSQDEISRRGCLFFLSHFALLNMTLCLSDKLFLVVLLYHIIFLTEDRILMELLFIWFVGFVLLHFAKVFLCKGTLPIFCSCRTRNDLFFFCPEWMIKGSPHPVFSYYFSLDAFDGYF